MFALCAQSAGCVQFAGMPPLPSGTTSDTGLYGVSPTVWSANVMAGRDAIRSASGFRWELEATAPGEELVRAAEVRERYAGVIYVGDSQIREVAWAALGLLASGSPVEWNMSDPVFSRSNIAKRRPTVIPGAQASQATWATGCVPRVVGKTGFHASCGAPGQPCLLSSPFANASEAERMRLLLLTRPHEWSGALTVPDHLCESDFFISYQATAAPPPHPRAP